MFHLVADFVEVSLAFSFSLNLKAVLSLPNEKVSLHIV